MRKHVIIAGAGGSVEALYSFRWIAYQYHLRFYSSQRFGQDRIVEKGY